MAFKMKGPSLLKMVKQMREGTPATMKTEDNKEPRAGMKEKEVEVMTYTKDKNQQSKIKNRKKAETATPAKQDLGSLQTNRNKEEAAKSLGQTIEENKNVKTTSFGETVDAMSKREDIKTGDLDYRGGSFDEAFADAKKSGAGVFTYNGKKYRTQTKKDKEMDDALSKIPKKKIQPLPVKTDAELKSKK